MLTELISKENFITLLAVDGWKDAFKIASQPLINSKKIKPEYVEAMIKRVEELGPFINLGKGIAIPHARPEDGVLEKSMSLLKLEEPVQLLNQEGQEVNILIVIATTDNESHLKALQELTVFLREDENIRQLNQIETYEEFVALINNTKE